MARFHPLFRLVQCSCAALLLLLPSCRKETPPPPVAPEPQPSAWLSVEHVVDGQPLQLDSLCHLTESGSIYSVTRLVYYLSELVLIGTDGTTNDTLHGPWYMDAREAVAIPLAGLRPGAYSGARLLLGLPPGLNTSGALPNTLANSHMAWPEPMGGGYHFMKLEGHFTGSGGVAGYALHLGTDAFLPVCTLPGGFTIPGAAGTLVLTFNINEVFRAPHTYDLDAGNYSMGSPVWMGQLRDNCTDAFSLEYQP